MTNLTKLTKSEPKFVKMVNLVMQKITCRIVSDAMNNEKNAWHSWHSWQSLKESVPRVSRVPSKKLHETVEIVETVVMFTN